MDSTETLGKDQLKRITSLEEKANLQDTRGVKMASDFANVKWRIEKLEKGGVAAPAETADDNENFDTGDSGRHLNRLATQLKKVEMRLEDFKERREIEVEFARLEEKITDLASLKQEAQTTSNPAPSFSLPDDSKLTSTLKKLSYLEKTLITLESDVRLYEEAKVIASLQ